jgi:hypothetical protein
MAFKEPGLPGEPSPERPKTLYHASPVPDLDEIHPRAQSVRDPDEGPQVFATPDRAMATIFISRYRWTQSGKHNGVPYIIIADKAAFLASDKEGVIYELPPEGFGCKPDMGLGEDEWTCPTSVRPVGKQVVPSALEAMLEAGVQVYFVPDKETLRRIHSSPDYGLAELRAMRSENQERGINVVEFPESDQEDGG